MPINFRISALVPVGLIVESVAQLDDTILVTARAGIHVATCPLCASPSRRVHSRYVRAPSNFAATNPEVLSKTFETGGENLLSGLTNLLDDLQRRKGRLSVTMTDMNAFRLGENIATTPGKVVFQNEMIQLIQYTPMTQQVRKTPLLIIPPWINKFYVLDLQPKNSFIRWCVEQGNTVFVISWVNPDARQRDKSFEHYMLEGALAAMAAIEKATGERAVNCVG